MSCLFLSGHPSRHAVPVLNPRCSIGLLFYTAMLLISSQKNGPFFPYYCTICDENQV